MLHRNKKSNIFYYFRVGFSNSVNFFEPKWFMEKGVELPQAEFWEKNSFGKRDASLFKREEEEEGGGWCSKLTQEWLANIDIKSMY